MCKAVVCLGGTIFWLKMLLSNPRFIVTGRPMRLVAVLSYTTLFAAIETFSEGESNQWPGF